MNSLLSSEPVAACQVSKGNPADTLRATAAKKYIEKGAFASTHVTPIRRGQAAPRTSVLGLERRQSAPAVP